MLIAPSILTADFSRLAEEVAALEKGGADWIHVDVMDGHFVPNISIGLPIVQALKKITKLPLDVHLMIDNPGCYIDDFRKAGADIITVHIENNPHIDAVLRKIRAGGAKAGLALNPGTPLFHLDHLWELLDLILIRSEEHTSELQSRSTISYAVFCLKKKFF